MNSISKKKSFLIISIIFVIFWLITDLFYSRFINNDNSYGCLNFNKKNNFYDLKQNCSSNEKIVKTSFSYQVHTDKHGYRFSGKEIKDLFGGAYWNLGGQFIDYGPSTLTE